MENLIIQAKKEDINAKNEIIKAFTPLVISESKKVFIKNRNYEELIQMGITIYFMQLNYLICLGILKPLLPMQLLVLKTAIDLL